MQTYQLLDFLCSQTDNFEKAKTNYMVVVDSIGPLEHRLDVISFIFRAFNPIYPLKYAYTREVMNKIGNAFLPELIESNDVRDKFGLLLDKNYNHFKESVQDDAIKVDVTQELLLLVYLPMIGFQFPSMQAY